MAVAFVGGAALGAVFGELLKVVVEVTKKTLRFKTLLKRIETTLIKLQPVVMEMAQLNEVLDHPEEETKQFICYLKRGKKLVLKCSRIKVWELRRKHAHTNKLIGLDEELLRFFQIDVQARLACNSMRNRIGINDLTDKMDRVLSSVTSRAGGFSGSCSVPGLPERIIGLDRHLAESKRMLLKNDTRVLVISAPGGCGKTTLTKMLCHDDEIIGTHLPSSLCLLFLLLHSCIIASYLELHKPRDLKAPSLIGPKLCETVLTGQKGQDCWSHPVINKTFFPLLSVWHDDIFTFNVAFMV